jgi:hypothetical protein
MKRIIFGILVIPFLFCCGPTTKITASWKNPDQPDKSYSSFFVAALTRDVIAKSTAENDIAGELEKYKVSVTRSLGAFQPGIKKDSLTLEEILSYVRSNSIQSILSVSILKKSTVTRYVPGSYSYAPLATYTYYSRFGYYYTHWSPYLYDPGYYTKEDVYFMETNLYDAATEALVWSAQSKTYDASGMNPFSREFSKTIVTKLAAEGLIKTIPS